MTEPAPIQHWHEVGTEFDAGERCSIVEVLNSDREPHVSVARCRVAPGTLTQRHCLSVTERYVIESGVGILYLGIDENFDLVAGDVVVIPTDTAQQIRNTGDADLVFLCICTPRFTPGCYVNLEDDAQPFSGRTFENSVD